MYMYLLARYVVPYHRSEPILLLDLLRAEITKDNVAYYTTSLSLANLLHVHVCMIIP